MIILEGKDEERVETSMEFIKQLWLQTSNKPMSSDYLVDVILIPLMEKYQQDLIKIKEKYNG